MIIMDSFLGIFWCWNQKFYKNLNHGENRYIYKHIIMIRSAVILYALFMHQSTKNKIIFNYLV